LLISFTHHMNSHLLVSSCHIIPHNLLSDEHVWAHPCCLTPPPQEKNRWFKRSHIVWSSIRSRWHLPVDFMAPRMILSSCYIYLLFLYDFCYVTSTLIILWHLSLYILLLYMLSSWCMYEMHPALSLKTGCDRSGIRWNVDCRTKPR
jgi:hypothetical protein